MFAETLAPCPLGAPRGLPTLLACLLALAPGCSETSSHRPDLVLITMDGVLAQSLECYGGAPSLGAEICALGETGARYVWAFASAPSAAPSAASLLSSQYPHAHGVEASAATFLRHGTPTLQESLRKAGYATAAFIGSPGLNRSRHFQQGFDTFDDRAASQAHPNVGQSAVSWTVTAPRPWFVWIHFSLGDLAPPPRESATGIDRSRSRERALRALDRNLSQLVAVLDMRPARPGILLAALHGQTLPGERAIATEHSVTLAEIRVPLLWRPPRSGSGSGVGRRVTLPVSLLDVGPTLLEAAGIQRPPSFEGDPLPHDDAARSADADPGRAIFAESKVELAVIRNGEYATRSRHPPTAGSAPEDPPEGRTATLWSGGDRTREGVPQIDRGQIARERLARLGPLLTSFEARLSSAD